MEKVMQRLEDFRQSSHKQGAVGKMPLVFADSTLQVLFTAG